MFFFIFSVVLRRQSPNEKTVIFRKVISRKRRGFAESFYPNRRNPCGR